MSGAVAIRRRVDALAVGEMHYFTGKPCHRGHVAPRFASAGYCTQCRTEYARARRADDPDCIKKDFAQKREADPDWEARVKAKWKATHPEQAKIYSSVSRFRHGALLNLRTREWRARNAGHILEYNQRYARENPERVAAIKRRWNALNAETLRVLYRNRRLRLRASGSHTVDDIRDILRMQRYRCAYCRVTLRGRNYHVDHIVPVVLMGHNNRSNLQCTCPPCNLSKGKKLPEVFARSRGFLL